MSLWDKRTLNPLLSVPLLSRSAWRRCAPASGSSASAARSSTPNSTRRSWRDCTCRCGSTTPPGPSPTTWWRCSLWRAARAPEHVCVRVSVCVAVDERLTGEHVTITPDSRTETSHSSLDVCWLRWFCLVFLWLIWSGSEIRRRSWNVSVNTKVINADRASFC